MGSRAFVGPTSSPTARPGASARRGRFSAGDLILVSAVIALGVLGLLILYSASTDFSLLQYGSATFIFNKQVLWFGIGIGVALFASRLDYHIWQRAAVPLMGFTVLLLVAVLLTGQERLGAIRAFFGGSVQPSELAKLATVLYLSVWLFSKRGYLHDVQLGLVPLAVILGVLGGLIYLQPDLSAAMTIFILGGLLFFLAGGEMKQIVLFCVVALAAGWVVIQLSSTGQSRLLAYIAGLKDPLKSSDHVLWSLESIYRGGWFGVGIGQASTKLIGLPFAATDSIFAVIVEEMGLFGAVTLAALYGILIWRGLKIALRAPDSLGAVMAAGLTFWIAVEAFINMAVMVGLLPFAGNALPFISAGGSNLISSLAGIGILLSISRGTGKRIPAEADGEAPGPSSPLERRAYGATADLRRRDRRRRLPRAGRP
jgi:cell division protein FtsW